MKIQPKYSYVCEICEKPFDSKYQCDEHERECKIRKNRIKNCKYCDGRGYKKEKSQYIGSVSTAGGSYRLAIMADWYNVRCPYCNY